MKILQIGVPKSGNLWLYQIIERIMELSGRDTPGFIATHPIQALAKNWDLNYPGQANIDMIDITDLQVIYRIGNIFRMPLENFPDYLKKTHHVWTHSPICKRSSEVFRFFDKKVYIIRDPRDVAISASNYHCSEYMLKYFPQSERDPQRFLEKNFDDLLKKWVWHVWDHLQHREKYTIHIAFFEGFLTNFQKECSLLLEYLNVDLASTEKQELEKAVNFNTLKKENPKHLRKGTSGQWQNHLSEGQKARVGIIAAPLMEYLGYLEKVKEVSFRRTFPYKDFDNLKQALMASQQRL